MAVRSLCRGLTVALGLCLLGSVEARAGDQEELNVKRRQLMEARETLGQELGAERLGAVQAAQAEVAELKLWVDFYRGLNLFSDFESGVSTSIVSLEIWVRQEEQNLAFWRRDDQAKEQTDGPQTEIAKGKVEAAKETLRQFKETMIDTDLERVRELSDQGIRTFDELERRHKESQALLASLDAEGGRVCSLVQKIANLTREVRDLEVRVSGEAVFRLVHVLRRPRGGFEHSIPKHVVGNGGSWTRIQSTRSSFHIQTHGVLHQTYEDWDFKLTFKGLENEIRVRADARFELKVEATGKCTVDSNVPEEKLTGQGAVLDSEAYGAITRPEKGGLKVNVMNPSDKYTFKFIVNPHGHDAQVHFFLAGTPMVVTHIYRRD